MAKIRSLRLQLTIVIVAITVVLTLIMGMMNIRSINIYSTEVANTGLNWQTQKTAGSLNRMLIRTQDAADFVAGTVQQDFTTISQVQDPDFRESRKIISAAGLKQRRPPCPLSMGSTSISMKT